MTAHAVEHKLTERANAALNLRQTLAGIGHDDDEELVIDTIEGETDFFEIIDAALREIDGCDVIIEGCKAREAELAARRSRASARRDKMRAAIEQALMIADIYEKVQRPTATINLTKRKPGLVVDDESAIPSQFFVPQPPKLDKKALREAVDGAAVPGCRLDNGGVSLTIRRK